ncbi:MAG: NUDIX hydrolase [Fusobacteriaceae bacterium]|nr:NUDIX hydrolase [Fusobacteriaceae bacterium]
MKFLKVAIEKHPVSGMNLEYLEKRNAIAALFLDQSGEKALFVKQYRPGFKGELLEIPAGIMEDDEDPMNTLLRELREETGFEKEDYNFLYIPKKSLILSPGCSTETLYIFIVQLKDNNIKPKNLKLDDGEILDNHWIYLNEIEEMTTDFKTIFSLNLYKTLKK